jgi:menaquinone-dependent protoporphyrinogen IX oxidase
MNGALFYSGQYGSTAQYAQWISEAVDLPVFDIHHNRADPSNYEFLVLGSSVIIYKLTLRKWLRKNLDKIKNKPIILFTVSGAPAGPELDSWIANSVPESLIPQIKHIPLRGRLDLKQVSWWVRLLLKIGAWANKDQDAKQDELHGFDYMDKAGIDPLIALVKAWTEDSVTSIEPETQAG